MSQHIAGVGHVVQPCTTATTSIVRVLADRRRRRTRGCLAQGTHQAQLHLLLWSAGYVDEDLSKVCSMSNTSIHGNINCSRCGREVFTQRTNLLCALTELLLFSAPVVQCQVLDAIEKVRVSTAHL